MNNDKIAQIKRLIEAKGPQGVNAIAKHIDVPLSTTQKYLHSQRYFVFTDKRKWDIPDNAVTNQVMSNNDDFESAIDAQLTGIDSLATLLTNNIKSAITLLAAQKHSIAPVAPTPDLEPEILNLDKRVKEIKLVFKKYVGKVPEDYQHLLRNLDFARLIVEKGTEFMNTEFNPEITALFLEQEDTLSYGVVEILKNYQKGE